MTHIVFVKKILANGQACKKCVEVSERLLEDGLMPLINQTIIADERDSDSPGMVLARKHSVSRAPFFVVEDQEGQEQVFDVYFKFRKAVSSADNQIKKSL